jgi:hypothetical protein
VIENVFSSIGLVDTHGDFVRNIVSIRVTQELFDDLSDDPHERDAAVALESAHKPALYVSGRPVIDRPFEEAAWNDAIGYPFRQWMRSRYSDGTFGIWYGADTVETSVHETAHHWRNGFLADAGFLQPGIIGERKIYRVRCDASLVDLRPEVAMFPALVDPVDHVLTHQVGAKLHREGHPGLLSKSARCDGDVAAVLNPRVLSDPRFQFFLTYTTTTRGMRVEKTPGKTFMKLG